METKTCPACEQTINRHCVFCVHCGKRFAGTGKDPALTVRENMGMSPSAAIEAFSSIHKTKTAMAAELGISRN